ncbi:MAG: adenylate/guanylate cyclase domain-containing protein, partial [Sideroxydans sp.]
MEQRGNKTIICAVFFLDIVEYSKKSVTGQISLKERFNAFLSIAIRDVPVADRIILDTGDGAAISFLGDIEDALQAALSMRSSLLGEGVRMDPPLLVRMGINLGPVRLVKDINGSPNIVGDGINVAQRVMGFADPGQILVSRSYFDAVSRLSHEYAGMFHYQGARTDKHVREHEVYAIGYPGDLTSTRRSVVLEDEVEHSTGVHRILIQTKRQWYAFSHKLANVERYAVALFAKATWVQRVSFVAVAGSLLIGAGMVVYQLSHQPDEQDLVITDAGMTGMATIPASAAPQTELKNVVQPPDKEMQVTAPAPAPAKQKKVAPPAEKKIQGVKESERVRTLEETTGGPGVVGLIIQPWGEIYLDGKKQGVSPPLLEMQVVPGKHTLEIRN